MERQRLIQARLNSLCVVHFTRGPLYNLYSTVQGSRYRPANRLLAVLYELVFRIADRMDQHVSVTK